MIHVATMSDYAGGLVAFAGTKVAATKGLRAAYFKARKMMDVRPGHSRGRTWAEAQEWFGMNHFEVEVGKAYSLHLDGTGWEVQ